MIRRRQDGRTGVLRDGQFIKTLRSLGEVGIRADFLRRGANPVRNAGIHSRKERIDRVSKLDHRRLDDALAEFADLQGQVL